MPVVSQWLETQKSFPAVHLTLIWCKRIFFCQFWLAISVDLSTKHTHNCIVRMVLTHIHWGWKIHKWNSLGNSMTTAEKHLLEIPIKFWKWTVALAVSLLYARQSTIKRQTVYLWATWHMLNVHAIFQWQNTARYSEETKSKQSSKFHYRCRQVQIVCRTFDVCVIRMYNYEQKGVVQAPN